MAVTARKAWARVGHEWTRAGLRLVVITIDGVGMVSTVVNAASRKLPDPGSIPGYSTSCLRMRCEGESLADCE